MNRAKIMRKIGQLRLIVKGVRSLVGRPLFSRESVGQRAGFLCKKEFYLRELSSPDHYSLRDFAPTFGIPQFGSSLFPPEPASKLEIGAKF